MEIEGTVKLAIKNPFQKNITLKQINESNVHLYYLINNLINIEP